jgi:general secretion pathway protein J
VKRTEGFTLVELLLALALVGIVSLLVVGGTRFAALGLDRTAAASERLDARRNLDELLQRALSAAVALPLLPNEPPLVGRADAVEFLSLAEDGEAGVYRITLDVENGGLVLRRLRIDAPAAAPARSLLVPRVASFALAYFGAADPAESEPQWHKRWGRLPYLPRLVRVTVGTGDGPPQRVVVRLWAAE